jgi:hypothetical protein
MGSICLEVIAGATRVWFARNITGLKVNFFVKNTVLKCLGAFVLILAFSSIPSLLVREGFLRAFLTGICSTTTFIIFVRYIGLTSDEKAKVLEIIHLLYVKTKILIKPSFRWVPRKSQM